MSLTSLEQGFRLVWGYLSALKKRKETDFKKLEWSFNSLSGMCDKEGFVDSSNELKSLGMKIIKQKEISTKDINEFKRIMAKTVGKK